MKQRLTFDNIASLCRRASEDPGKRPCCCDLNNAKPARVMQLPFICMRREFCYLTAGQRAALKDTETDGVEEDP